jgi:hypothetical protein
MAQLTKSVKFYRVFLYILPFLQNFDKSGKKPRVNSYPHNTYVIKRKVVVHDSGLADHVKQRWIRLYQRNKFSRTFNLVFFGLRVNGE